MDYWGKDESSLRLMHEMEMYPPRLVMEVDINKKTIDSGSKFTLKIAFEGCEEKGSLDMEMNLPLGKIYLILTL